MQFILTNDEMEKMKKSAQCEGFKKCEILMEKVLDGDVKDLRRAKASLPYFDNHVPYEPVEDTSVWGKLLKLVTGRSNMAPERESRCRCVGLEHQSSCPESPESKGIIPF